MAMLVYQRVTNSEIGSVPQQMRPKGLMQISSSCRCIASIVSSIANELRQDWPWAFRFVLLLVFHVFHVFFAGSIKKSINKILYIPWRIHGAGIYANIKGYIDGIHGTPYILDLDLRYVNIILFSRGSNICLAPKNCERPGEVDRNSLLASGCLKKKAMVRLSFSSHKSTSFNIIQTLKRHW